MSTSNQVIHPPQRPFVTLGQALNQFQALVVAAPAGGELLGFKASYKSHGFIWTPPETGETNWRIGVSIEIPRFANAVFGQLARWSVPGARKRIEFVVKALCEGAIWSNGDGPKYKAHLYTLMNGSYHSVRQPTEMKQAKPFRDRQLRRLYGSVFESTNFEEILKAIRSEIAAHPDLKEA